ncbi:MAG: hypothetical protein LBD17_06680 [Endomicrobium sp.]|jgi:hypothetical protein|nr:hypothetical protein [Endomicrobium sp.]
MKKIILSLLLSLAILDSALANWGEINAKFGLDYPTKNKLYEDISAYSGKGQSVSLECLLHILMLSFLKFGAGVEYLLPRKFDKDYSETFSFCPVYITVQINPFLGGLFIKGNFGQNIYSDIDKEILADVSGGQYYDMEIGYELPFGLIVELAHSNYKASGTVRLLPVNISYSKNSINVGYKFKI